MDTWKLTGKTRHRLLNRLCYTPVFVLQVEIEVEVPTDDGNSYITRKMFVDAEAHHLNLIVIKSDKKGDS